MLSLKLLFAVLLSSFVPVTKKTAPAIASKQQLKHSFQFAKHQNGNKKKRSGPKNPNPSFDLKHEIHDLQSVLKSSALAGPYRSPSAQPLTVRDIPFLREAFSHGTQAPVLRVYITLQTITTTTTAVTGVVPIAPAVLLDWSSFDDLFSEFRYVRGEVHYMPFQQLSSAVTGAVKPTVGIISYRDGDNGALANYSAGVIFDTKKWFIPVTVDSFGETKLHVTKWKLSFDFVPDQQWWPVSDTTEVCYWKCFGDITATNATPVGFITGWVDIQFRGMQ